MEVEFLNTNNIEEWNEFCLNNPNCWFRHTTYWMDYILNCRFDDKPNNLSFLIRQDKKIIAIIPLILQYIYNDKENSEFANYDTPTPYYAISEEIKYRKQRTKLEKYINNTIEEFAKKNRIKQSLFFIDPLIHTNYTNEFANFNLMKFQYKPNLKTTNLISFNKSLENIKLDMKETIRQDIKYLSNSNEYRVDIFNKNNFKNEYIDIYKNIHFIDAGFQTRKNESWINMSDWIKNGNAVLILVWINSLNKYCAGGLFITYKNKAYYGSYATIDTNLLQSKIGTLIQWSAIKYFKENNYSEYEIGTNIYNTYSQNQINDKLIKISEYKKGFASKERLFITYEREYE